MAYSKREEYEPPVRALDIECLQTVGKVANLLVILKEREDRQRFDSFRRAIREAIEGY